MRKVRSFRWWLKNAWEKSRSNSLSRSTEDQFFYVFTGKHPKINWYPTRHNDLLIICLRFSPERLIMHYWKMPANAAIFLSYIKNVAVKHVFSHPDVEQLELQGYRVISGLLEIYRPLLNLPLSDFTELVEKERVKRFPIETRLFHKLSTRHRLAYVEAVSKLPSDSPEFPLWEYYYRCRLLQDYISGMTDLYAWDEYRRLMAVEQ